MTSRSIWSANLQTPQEAVDFFGFGHQLLCCFLLFLFFLFVCSKSRLKLRSIRGISIKEISVSWFNRSVKKEIKHKAPESEHYVDPACFSTGPVFRDQESWMSLAQLVYFLTGLRLIACTCRPSNFFKEKERRETHSHAEMQRK